MTSAWIDNGPVSLPPRSVAYGAGAVILALAIAGVGLGFRAGWRDGSAASYAEGGAASAGGDAIEARPIVEIAAPVAPTPTLTDEEKAAKAKAEAEAAEKAKELAAQQAAAQAVQSSPDRHAANIDEILTSASEKPPTPAKPVAEEAPPLKTDVPF